MPTKIPIVTGTQVFWPNRTISLQRQVGADWITVDSVIVPNIDSSIWFDLSDNPRSIQRDITQHKCIRRLWDSNMRDPNLGNVNSYIDPNSLLIQAHPEDKSFTNVGEIGTLFRKSAYSQGPNPIGPTDTEATTRLNLADPCYQNLFQYLTKFDPNADGIDNDGDGTPDNGELKVPGRININTAPWYVLAQLPWVSQRVGYNNPALAQAIVACRDKLDLSSIGGPDYSGRLGDYGFKSIGGLCDVTLGNDPNFGINYYSRDGLDQSGFPELDPNNGIVDDFKERDMIFARISNLATVRSDVFTAYILVRIGTDGPQKRVMAILDRSNVHSPTDKVRVISLHQVPDPR
jgi:hypothetical protein